MSERTELRWRCRRGMKELDILLLRYLEHCYGQASRQEREAFSQLLDLQDPELLAFLMGRATPEDKVMADVAASISIYRS